MAFNTNKLSLVSLFGLAALTLIVCTQNVSAAPQDGSNYLDVETPTFFNYNSPLKQPDSLRSRPYFDFLSTLYRRDTTKSDLFRPYNGRVRRQVEEVSVPEVVPEAETVAEPVAVSLPSVPEPVVVEQRHKRAIIFRPLFVYKQQQVKRQDLAEERRRKRL